MSIWSAMVGAFRRRPRNREGLEDHLEYLRSLRAPALALTESAERCRSSIGGLPWLGDAMPWPKWKGAPLGFLCQFDLGEVPEGAGRPGLPRNGMLSFFYDRKQRTWGFDPKDRESWRVIYQADPSSAPHPRTAPDGVEPDFVYPAKAIGFRPIQTYPDGLDRRVLALNLTDWQCDAYADLCMSVHGRGPAHQLFGYPLPLQTNDMDLECQLVSHGLSGGNTSDFAHRKAKELEPGRRDWILLLQLDSDEETGMMWGDGGMLYFWIKRSDLARSCFDDCWMILQST